MQAIVVLDDGDTYSGIDGCSICIITDMEAEMLTNDEIRCKDLHPIFEMGLKEYPNPHVEG